MVDRVITDSFLFATIGNHSLPQNHHMKIQDLFFALETEPSKNAKIELLREKMTDEIQQVFIAGLDPTILFYVKKPINYVRRPVDQPAEMSLNTAVNNAFDRISGRKITGNAAIEWLRSTLEKLSADDAEIFHRVLMKDLRLGLSEVTFNKAMGEEIIKEWPCLLASKFTQKAFDALPWATGVFVQEKSDGVRANILIDPEGQVSVFSRNGKEIDCKGVFDYLSQTYNNVVLDGELLVADGGNFDKPMSRKQGNGIINKAIKGTISQDEADGIFMNAWDIIPMQDFLNKASNRPYKTRFGVLTGVGSRLKVIESLFTTDKQSVVEFYARMRAEGKEGAIVKSPDGLWSDSRPKTQIKLKAEIHATLRVVGTFEGQGKYEGMLGGLVCRTEDGMLTTNVGSGFDDEQRKRPVDEWIGTLVEIKFNELIQNKKNSDVTMFLPIFVEQRLDKELADDLKDLQSRKD